MCFDACPVHVCLPYVASRIAAVTPNAKIIVMLRDPLKGVFSGEVTGAIGFALLMLCDLQPDVLHPSCAPWSRRGSS